MCVSPYVAESSIANIQQNHIILLLRICITEIQEKMLNDVINRFIGKWYFVLIHSKQTSFMVCTQLRKIYLQVMTLQRFTRTAQCHRVVA